MSVDPTGMVEKEPPPPPGSNQPRSISESLGADGSNLVFGAQTGGLLVGAGVGVGLVPSGGNGDRVQSLVNAQNAAMYNPNFAPDTPAAGITHCNQGANNIAAALGVKTVGILSNSQGVALPANAQIANLANSQNGYQSVSPQQAQQLANSGTVVFATQIGRVHGHIATVRPEGVPGDQPPRGIGPLLANIGQINGVVHESRVLTPKHGEIIYYAPNQ